MYNLEANSIKKAIADWFTDQLYDLGNLSIKLHADNGSYYNASTVQDYLRDNHVKFSSSTPHNHEQNGVAEQDITRIMRSLLIDKDLL